MSSPLEKLLASHGFGKDSGLMCVCASLLASASWSVTCPRTSERILINYWLKARALLKHPLLEWLGPQLSTTIKACQFLSGQGLPKPNHRLQDFRPSFKKRGEWFGSV